MAFVVLLRPANGLSSTHHAKRKCGWRAKAAKDEHQKSPGSAVQEICYLSGSGGSKHNKPELNCQCCVQVRQISDLTDLDEPEAWLGTCKVMVNVLDYLMQSNCINRNRFGPRRGDSGTRFIPF